MLHGFQGSGLGLYIAKQLVEMHNGSLTAKSEGEGKGAEFILKIPAFIHKQQDVNIEEEKDKSASQRNNAADYVSTNENSDTSLSLKIQSFLQSMSPVSVIEECGTLENMEDDRDRPVHDIEMGSELISQVTPTSDQVLSDSQSQKSYQYSALNSTAEVNLGVSLADGDINGSADVNLSTLHVLIVDDVDSTRKIMERLLRRKIAKISQAVNGQECVDFLTNKKNEVVHFVLLDYEMPVLNGPDAAKYLRSQGYTVPIIGITGNTLPEEKELFLKSGADQVLTKPIDLESLLNCMSMLLKRLTA